MVLEGKQVYLRDSSFDDCTLFAKWERNQAVSKFLTIDEENRTYEQVVTEFVGRLGDKTQAQFTVCLRENDKPIGRVYISRIDDHYDSMDLTRIYIGETDCRGKGYGEEAIRLVLDYGFKKLNCQRITLDHFTGNEVAAGLYKKVGFQYEGIMRSCGKKNGKYVDFNLMSILRDEYL